MNSTMNLWVESILQSPQKLAMPIMTHPGIDLVGKKVIDAVTDGNVQFEAVKAVQDNYPTAAATMMMDLTVEAEAFGSTIKFAGNEIPVVAKCLVSDLKTIQELQVPLLNRARVPQYLKAARLAVGRIADKPVFGGCIGPFSLAGRLFDLSEMMTALYTEPDSIKLLLEKSAAFLLAYAREMKTLGADGIIMAEPAAGLLSPAMCDEFSSQYIQPIVSQVQDEHFLFILHNCGNKGQVTRSMLATGAGGLPFGNVVNLSETLKEMTADILALGNLDPVGVFKMARPEEVFEATAKLLLRTADRKNFLASSGCDLPPQVPPQNVEAFFAAVGAFNAQKPEEHLAMEYAP